MKSGLLHVADELVIDPFEADRLVRQDLGRVVAGRVDVGVAEHEQRARPGIRDQVDRRLEHGDQRSLAADQRARDVGAVLGQEIGQVVAGHAARNAREAQAQVLCAAIAQLLDLRVDLAPPSARANDRRQLLLAGAPDPHPETVVGENLQLVYVVGRPCPVPGERRHHRVDAAGVVADHPAQGAVVVRRGIGTEGQPVGLRRSAQIVEDAARLDPSEPTPGVDLDHPVEVLRHVEDDRRVAALSRQARTAAARGDRGGESSRHLHRGNDVLLVERQHDTDRRLPVVRAVGRIERTAAVVEAHLAPHLPAQRLLEGRPIRARWRREDVRFVVAAGKTLAVSSAAGAAVVVVIFGRHPMRNRSASLRLNSSPIPGRDGSGCRAPSRGARAPSNSMCSMRAWS